VGACIDLVVHCRMLPSGKRCVEEIATVSWDPQGQRIDIAQVQV
jgi:hypothetical protein